jgi:uncharacterized protein (UPF0332 family)
LGEIKKETASWLKKSESALQAAESLQKQGLLSDSISRAYYAMFYSAKALLCQDGISVNKHSAVISAFGKSYAKTGKLPNELHKQLINAFEERDKADYDVLWEITEDSVNQRIAEARIFVDEIKLYLKSV